MLARRCFMNFHRSPDVTPHSPDHPALPLWIKLAYTGFLVVLLPIYSWHYGPTNFLYFCDIALLLTGVAVWKESRLLASIAAVGILVPQLFWCLDFLGQFLRSAAGSPHTGMTAYMFDGDRPLYLRALSLFHGWLPFLLLFLLARLGYDPRALPLWSAASAAICVVSYTLLPPAGALLDDPNLPRNINYVFGLSDDAPQAYMPSEWYLVCWVAVLCLFAFLPTHFVLRKLFGNLTAEI